MKVLFLGQNPSSAAPNSVFVGTKSGILLQKLIEDAKIPMQDISFANCLATPSSKPLPRSMFDKKGKESSFALFLLNFDLVYVCGSMAKVAIDRARNHHFLGRIVFVEIPHPSPRNRFWNDKDSFNKVSDMIRLGYESAVTKKMEKISKRKHPQHIVDR
jgi:uracil-DNA glycosylase